MSNRSKCRVVQGQRDSSNGLDTRGKPIEQLCLGNVKDIGSESVSLIEDLDNGHSVCERRDVQHVQESRLGGSDTGTSSDDLDVGNDFNGTTRDLGGDTQSLEERRLSGFHTGVSGRDGDVLGGESTCTSGGGDFVGGDDLTDFLEVVVREDEPDVSANVGEETFELGVLAEDGTKGAADHGVFAHDDYTFATESDTDLMHLVGPDIVDVYNEDGG